MFFHMLLLADDFGCISVSPTFLRRRCFSDGPTVERIAKLLGELMDADLIRTYEVDRACLAFIPRFGQRLQRNTLKHAAPPESLYQDDKDAKEKFSKINDKTINPTVGQPLSTVGQPPEVKRSEEKRKEQVSRKLDFEFPSWLPKETWTAYVEMRRKIKKPLTDDAVELAVKKLARLSGSRTEEAKAILEQSIFQSWQGLFPLRAEDAVVRPAPRPAVLAEMEKPIAATPAGRGAGLAALKDALK